MGRRVLIVDDHESFRRFARRLLEDAGYSVVGEATNGAEALDLAAELDPEVVLLDIVLPDTTGFDVAAKLAADNAGPAIVLTSSRSASDLGDRLAETPARGFVPKSELSPRELERVLA